MIEVEESLSFNGIERPKSKANYAISDKTKKGISGLNCTKPTILL